MIRKLYKVFIASNDSNTFRNQIEQVDMNVINETENLFETEKEILTKGNGEFVNYFNSKEEANEFKTTIINTYIQELEKELAKVKRVIRI